MANGSYRVYLVLREFLAHRGLALAGEPLAPAAAGGGPLPPAQHAALLNGLGYYEIDAALPGGRRMVLLQVGEGSKYAQQSPQLRSLLQQVQQAKAGTPAEALVVLPEGAADRSQLRQVVGEFPWARALSDRVFCCKVPDNVQVPPHRVVDGARAATYMQGLDGEAGIPTVRYDDPAVVWAGGRIGDYVEVTRLSQLGCPEYYLRRVVR